MDERSIQRNAALPIGHAVNSGTALEWNSRQCNVSSFEKRGLSLTLHPTDRSLSGTIYDILVPKLTVVIRQVYARKEVVLVNVVASYVEPALCHRRDL